MSATVVTNTAAPPSIVMRILDPTGQDAQVVSLGDDLTLRIELKDQKGSAFAMFARNLYARSSSGESLFLIDNNGCPIDSSVFPALKLDQADNRSLYTRFKAFRFPSTGVVNFEVQIRFCQEFCEPIKCTQANEHVNSFGRRRRSVNSFQEILADLNSTQEDGNEFSFESGIQSAVKSNFTILNLSEAEKHKSGFSADGITNSSLPIESNVTARQGKETSVELQPLAEYTRTPSNQTGFAYPSSNYRHYSKGHSNADEARREADDLKDAKGGHFNLQFSSDSTSNGPLTTRRDSSNEPREDLFSPQTMASSTGQLHLRSSTWTEPQPVDRLVHHDGPQPAQSDLHWRSVVPLADSSIMLPHQMDSPYTDQAPVMKRKEDVLPMEGDSSWNGVSSAILPLPSVATEVPLSLAILVDDSDQFGNGDTGHNEFDEPAATYENTDHLAPINEHRLNLNYADMAKLETRNDLHFGRGKDSLPRNTVRLQGYRISYLYIFLFSALNNLLFHRERRSDSREERRSSRLS